MGNFVEEQVDPRSQPRKAIRKPKPKGTGSSDIRQFFNFDPSEPGPSKPNIEAVVAISDEDWHFFSIVYPRS